MTSLYSVLAAPLFQWISLLSLLLFCGQIYLCILSFRQGRSRAYRAAALLYLALSFVAISMLAEVSHTPGPHYRGIISHFAVAMVSLPWLLWLGAALVSAAVLVVFAVDIVRWSRDRLSPTAIKEALDLLPAGVCFCEEDGTVLLADLKMADLCRELTGHLLTDASALWDAAAAQGERQGEQLLLLRDDDALMLERQTVTVDGRAVLQLTAFDVTERVRAAEELRRVNERLRVLGARMRAYQAQKTDVLLSEEIMETQVYLHDQLGHALLQARYYLERPEQVDARDLLRSLRLVNVALLQETESLSPQEEPCEAAIAMARAIGVAVRTSGDPLPTDKQLRLLLGQAIRECAANTVKHAGGDLLELRVQRIESGTRIQLENNGRPPAGPIREAGGLLSLRRMTAAAGGRIELQSLPRACVTLELPTGEENADN